MTQAFDIEKLVRKHAKRYGLRVEPDKARRDGDVYTFELDGMFCGRRLSRFMVPTQPHVADAMIRHQVESVSEQIRASLVFEAIHEHDPDCVYVARHVECPVCGSGQLVDVVDFATRVYRCDGTTGPHAHQMPAHVFDGRVVRVRACPQSHPVDCDCEGALP